MNRCHLKAIGPNSAKNAQYSIECLLIGFLAIVYNQNISIALNHGKNLRQLSILYNTPQSIVMLTQSLQQIKLQFSDDLAINGYDFFYSPDHTRVAHLGLAKCQMLQVIVQNLSSWRDPNPFHLPLEHRWGPFQLCSASQNHLCSPSRNSDFTQVFHFRTRHGSQHLLH